MSWLPCGEGIGDWPLVLEEGSLAAVEAAIGEPLRQGNVVYEVSDQLLAALTAAYEEAGTGQLPT